MKIIYGYLVSYSYVLGLLAATTAIEKLTGLSINTLRKALHIFVAFTWVIMSRFLLDTWHFAVIPLTFVPATAVIIKYDLFKVLQRDHSDRGIFHYAVSMSVLCIISVLYPAGFISCGIAVFVLSFGDGASTIVGQAFGRAHGKIHQTKTLAGFIACFLFSILGILIYRAFFSFSIGFLHVFLIALVAAFMELIGGRLDNYSVPLGVFAASMLMRIGEAL